jgi:protein gp37
MTGCLHDCPYCYARKIANRFKGSKAWPHGFDPIFHTDRLLEPTDLQKPAIIFAGSMTDIFGDWWPEMSIHAVLSIIMNNSDHSIAMKNPRHQFVILTKNPIRAVEVLSQYKASELTNLYIGTSVTGDNNFGTELSRLLYLKRISQAGFKTVISFEPLLNDPAALISDVGGVSLADWIIIGGQTGPNKYPKDYWIASILASCHFTIPVFLKDNAQRPSKEPAFTGFKEFPCDLLPIAQSWGKA